MSSQPRPVLDYAKPPVTGFASNPAWVVLLVALIVPGLASFLIRRRVGRFLCHLAVIPFAFLFFGPFWGEVLFASTKYKEAGLWPFLAVCAATFFFSGWFALRDRARAHQG